MNKIRPLLIGVAIFFLAAGTVYAGEKDGAKSRDRSYEKKDKSAIYKELNLTEEQQKKIEANRTEQRKQREALSKSIKEEYKKLQKALEDPSQTKEKVEPIAQKIKSLQAEMVDNRINAIFEAKAIMTPEQFAQFNQLMEKRKGEKGGHSKKWRKEKADTDKNCP